MTKRYRCLATGGKVRRKGISEDTQQMDIPYAGELPDVTVRPRRIANKVWDKVQERWVGDMPTYYAVNPETGKEEMLREIGNGKYSTYDDKHVFDVLRAEAAKKEREQWIKNGGNAGDFDKVMLGTLGLGLAPIALPEIAAGVSTALANPYVDAGLTSYFGAHGLNHAINEGIDGWGDAAMTALELAPLGRLVKPVYEGVVQPGMRLFNSPLTGKWTTIGNRQYRLSPNSLGANGSPIESRKLGEYSTGIDLNKMRSIFEDYEKGLTQYKGSKLPNILEYNYKMPKIDFDNLVKDDFVDYLSQQIGKTVKRVPIKDTKHGGLYNEGFAFIDDEGREVAHIAGTRKAGKNVFVESSFVDPEFRYKGLGKQMYFDLNDHVFNTYGTTLHSDPMQRLGSTGVGMSPSNRLWKSLRDNGISTVEGEGFNRYDIMAEPSKITTAYRTPAAPQITAENAASITPEQWTAAQDAAIARGDMTEAQRLRDLHFATNAPNTVIKNVDGTPAHVYHGTFNKGWNSYDKRKFGTSTDNGMYGEGLYATSDRSYADVYARGNNADGKYIGEIKDLYINGEHPFYVFNKKDLSPKEIVNREDAAYQFGRTLKRQDDIPTPIWEEMNNSDIVIETKGTKRPNFAEIVVPRGEQMKLADAVTYNNNGVRIPLGERDNFSINDIRYGLLAPIAGATGYVLYNNTRKYGGSSRRCLANGGGGIHINPANKGKFTATMKRTGKTAEELSHSSNPLTRKRAIFALNARKWNH